MEFPDQNPTATQLGIHPQLAALETIVYPTSDQLQSNNSLAQVGTLEIVPMQAPLTLFIWSKNRVLPVRLTDLSVTEEAFDLGVAVVLGPGPIAGRPCLALRVESVDPVRATPPRSAVASLLADNALAPCLPLFEALADSASSTVQLALSERAALHVQVS